jgi:tetrahydromethanopterin S-methyltransferase subunit E
MDGGNTMKFDGMGVLVIVAHLIITITVIVAYLITLYLGKPDDVFKIAIPVIIGYWFGAMGSNTIRGNKKETKKEDGVE